MQAAIQNLETRASRLATLQCNDLCFLENCDSCKTGCLYQAGVLRSNAALLLLQDALELPPIPRELYLKTIQQIEKNKWQQSATGAPSL
jgi:hypothetical protein